MRRAALKISFVLPMLLLCATALAQGKYRAGQAPPVDPNPDHYTIKVHISATRFRPCAEFTFPVDCYQEVFADAAINGKKVELYFVVNKHQWQLIAPGDYSAKLAQKPIAGGNPVLFQGYVVLLPNKTALYPQITGIYE